MFVSPEALPHVLPPDHYWSRERHVREHDALFLPGWHVVGTVDEVARPGDFLTCELLGRPIQVRNFGGELQALSNVCAHRHCLLTSQPRGHTPRMRCQYHGWEYGPDGGTRHIPAPRNFVPFDSERNRIRVYRLATCGRLIFVSLSDEATSLRDYLGDFYDQCAERFGEAWRPFVTWAPEYSANWKVPVENSLEAYHVPWVHPKTFRADPGESASTHVLNGRHTALLTRLPFCAHSRLDAWYQRWEGRFLRCLGAAPTGEYQQHHVFPNLLFSFTDAVSLCHCVLPTGPTQSRATVRQFGYVGPASAPRRWLAGLWGRLAAAVTRRILREDMGLYPAIQRGLETSDNAGVLGRCEERIHAFQAYVHETLQERSQACQELVEELR